MTKIDIFVGTVYGNALLTAKKAKSILTKAGYVTELMEDNKIEYNPPYYDKVILIITSTTGNGNIPDNIIPLFEQIKSTINYQSKLSYGLIALGDSRYDCFCGAAKAFDKLLQERNAIRTGELLKIDAKIYQDPTLPVCNWIKYWYSLL